MNTNRTATETPDCPGCADPARAPHLSSCGLAWELPTRTWKCRCGIEVARYRGQDDVSCPNCGQWFNSFGQALRDDWMGNPSWTDDEIGDMEGYEIQQLRHEQND